MEDYYKDFCYDDFPKILQTEELNAACFQSLSGFSSDVSRFIVLLIEGKYTYQNHAWHKYDGIKWSVDPSNLSNFVKTQVAPIYLRLKSHYTDPKRVQWLEHLWQVLKHKSTQWQHLLETRYRIEDQEVVFDNNPHLLPFSNGIFDSSTCEFRSHSYKDYLTETIYYDLPEKSDPVVRRHICTFFENILPDVHVRKFFLEYLALHLEGRNSHQIIVFITGDAFVKDLLKDLMVRTFRVFHGEPSAAFLMTDNSHCGLNLLKLRLKRSVWVDNFPAGKTLSSRFLKQISGGDKIRCIYNADLIEYKPKFLLTLVCNDIPMMDMNSYAVRSRLLRVNLNDQVVQSFNSHCLKSVDTQSWGPEMMLYLVEIYKDYVQNGRNLNIPDSLRIPSVIAIAITHSRNETCKYATSIPLS